MPSLRVCGLWLSRLTKWLESPGFVLSGMHVDLLISGTPPSGTGGLELRREPCSRISKYFAPARTATRTLRKAGCRGGGRPAGHPEQAQQLVRASLRNISVVCAIRSTAARTPTVARPFSPPTLRFGPEEAFRNALLSRGLPPGQLLDRHPFQGPGLAIRCRCSSGGNGGRAGAGRRQRSPAH